MSDGMSKRRREYERRGAQIAHGLQRMSRAELEYLVCVVGSEGADPIVVRTARLRHEGLTLAQIGAEIGRCRDRTRQIVAKFWRHVEQAGISYAWGTGPLPSPCHRITGALRATRSGQA